jgi:hypothetical protein
MPGDVIPFAERHDEFDQEFDCRGCGDHVIAFVTYSRRQFCAGCEMFGPATYRIMKAAAEHADGE